MKDRLRDDLLYYLIGEGGVWTDWVYIVAGIAWQMIALYGLYSLVRAVVG